MPKVARMVEKEVDEAELVDELRAHIPTALRDGAFLWTPGANGNERGERINDGDVLMLRETDGSIYAPGVPVVAVKVVPEAAIVYTAFHTTDGRVAYQFFPDTMFVSKAGTTKATKAAPRKAARER